MINTITAALKDILNEFGFTKPITDDDIECAIDEEITDCKELEYTGIPAPTVLEDDPWFGPAVISDANTEYLQQEATQRLHDDIRRESETKEPEDIHEVMYQMAIASQGTSVQRDPIGGSETFQEGPGGWSSGVGR